MKNSEIPTTILETLSVKLNDIRAVKGDIKITITKKELRYLKSLVLLAETINAISEEIEE